MHLLAIFDGYKMDTMKLTSLRSVNFFDLSQFEPKLTAKTVNY